MPVDDRTRLNLHRKLDELLGSEEADTLMAHLPPVTWDQVATKDDLAQTAAMLRGEMQVMSTELRTEMHALRADLQTEMQVGFADIRTEMANLRSDFVEGTNRQIKWLVTFAAAWSSLLIMAVRLIP